MSFDDKSDRETKAADAAFSPFDLPLSTPKLEPLPRRIDAEPTVVGAQRVIEIARPRWRTAAGGILGCAIEAVEPATSTPSAFKDKLGLDPSMVLASDMTRAFAAEPEQYVGPDRALPPIRVLFAPTRAGVHEVIAAVSVRGPDTDRHDVLVRAPARKIDALPSAALGPAQHLFDDARPLPRDEREEPADTSASGQGDAFERTCNEARDRAADVAHQQLIGLGAAKGNALAYKQRPPPAPWWTDLADLAISMGVAGVAGIAARALGERIGKGLMHLGANASKPTDLKMVTGATDSLKEGMKRAGKQVLARGGTAPKTSDAPANASHRFSGNATIEFFAGQEAALAKAQGEYRALITTQQAQLRPVLRAAPDTANHTMQSIAGALEEAGRAGAHEQQAATESQWVSGLARSRHGQEAIPGAGNVTFLGGVRNEFGPSPHAVLQLVVALTPTARSLDARGARTLSATIHGVSQEIADRLAAEPLATRPVPIKLDVLQLGGLIRSVITRDEVGRVRVQGGLDAPDRAQHDFGARAAPRNEAQVQQAAEAFVEKLLSQSLAERGVKVVTDDATGLSSE